MKFSRKTAISVLIAVGITLLVLAAMVVWGLYLMAEEDRGGP
jgi:ABC-type transporter Mla subunit MlaD